jgi:hypothetical protein
VTEDLKAQVITDIKAHWDSVIRPQPSKHDWLSELKRLFPEYPIQDTTDLNYDKCHSFMVAVHRGPLKMEWSNAAEVEELALVGGRLTYLCIAISVVAPYGRLFMETRYLNPAGQVEIQPDEEASCLKEVQQVRRFFGEHGIVELPPDLLDTVIPEVELDLAKLGQVRIYNCLFFDEAI